MLFNLSNVFAYTLGFVRAQYHPAGKMQRNLIDRKKDAHCWTPLM
jgi:hypothetical protein